MNDYNLYPLYSDEPSLSADGRFGRLSYLGWFFVINLISFIVIFVIAAVVRMSGLNAADMSSPITFITSLLLITALYIGLLYYSFVVIIRRLHDLNRTGWLSLFLIIPLLNIIFTFYLVFAHGTEGENDYGLPHETKTWEKICAWFSVTVIPIVIIWGLATIAIPAYQDYVQQVQLQQMQMNSTEQELQATVNELQQLDQQLNQTQQDTMAASATGSSY